METQQEKKLQVVQQEIEAQTAPLLDQVAAETTARGIYAAMGDPMIASQKMGQMFAASGLLGVRTPEQGYVMALTCILEGITPLEFARTYDVIEGKLAKKAAAQQAQFQSRGGRIDWLVYSDGEVRARFSHPKLCPDGVEMGVTLKELQERGVTKGKDGEKANYKRFPRRMLKARCVSEGVSLVDPSINAGYYTVEELEDELEPRASAPAPTWSKPPPAAPETPTAPEEKQPEQKNGDGLSDRAKKVIAAFKSMGVSRDDLEHFAGRHEEVIFAGAWRDEDYSAFTGAKDRIKDTPAEERAAVVAEIFRLKPPERVPGEEG